MRYLITVALVVVAVIPDARAETLTINQCMAVYAGLDALGWAGRQLNDTRPTPADAKQYKLGELRGAIAFDMAKLQPVMDAFQKSRNAIIAEIIGDKANLISGTQAFTAQAQAQLTDALQKILDKPCDVAPDRVRLADLHLGDTGNDNQIPPAVLAALAPILDR